MKRINFIIFLSLRIIFLMGNFGTLKRFLELDLIKYFSWSILGNTLVLNGAKIIKFRSRFRQLKYGKPKTKKALSILKPKPDALFSCTPKQV